MLDGQPGLRVAGGTFAVPEAIESSTIYGQSSNMNSHFRIALVLVLLPLPAMSMARQNQSSANQPPTPTATDTARAYSGMYTFLKEGEFVQLTIDEERHVTGFVSRYGDGESDKGAFLDQFFKTASLEQNKLSFTTETVHGVWYEFRGRVERGEGKKPGDEAYYVMKGLLIENSTDANQKVSSHSQQVVFRLFPDLEPPTQPQSSKN